MFGQSFVILFLERARNVCLFYIRKLTSCYFDSCVSCAVSVLYQRWSWRYCTINTHAINFVIIWTSNWNLLFYYVHVWSETTVLIYFYTCGQNCWRNTAQKAQLDLGLTWGSDHFSYCSNIELVGLTKALFCHHYVYLYSESTEWERNEIILCLEYHSACPLVRIGSALPLSRKLVCPPPPGTKGGANSLAVCGPNSNDWRESLALCLYSVIERKLSSDHQQSVIHKVT
jgi:hypothetical protein